MTHRYQSIFLPSNPFSSRKKQHSSGSSLLCSRPALLILSLVPCIAVVSVLYKLAIVSNAFRTYEAHPPHFDPPLKVEGEDVESRVGAFPKWVSADWDSVESTVWGVKTELSRRLVEMGLPDSTVPCEGILSNRLDQPTLLQERYAHLLPSSTPSPYITEPQGYFLALNLWMSHKILPHMFQNLLSLAALLGPSNVHIAIFENGSWDETPEAMAHFARALTALGVAHTIRSSSQGTDWDHVDRIEQLALFRNVALQPLLTHTPTSPSLFTSPRVNVSGRAHPEVPTDVVFINDVFMCPGDVLELLHQRRFQGASATCGMDWRPAPEGGLWSWAKGLLSDNYRFYDNWVTRSMDGFPLRPRVDVFGELRDGVRELFHWDSDPTSLVRFRAGLPLPVYSCWNGLIALAARPFLPAGEPYHGSAVHFRKADEEQGECAASECKLVARDFWGVGEKRWVLVPRVAVTYEGDAYASDWLETRVRRGGVQGMQKDLKAGKFRQVPSEGMRLEERIDWDMVKDPEKVICFPYHKGERLEIWPLYREGTTMNSTSSLHPPGRPAHFPFEDILP